MVTEVISAEAYPENICPSQLAQHTCAWCLSEMGIVPQSGSHGICIVHREQVWREYKLRRTKKAS